MARTADRARRIVRAGLWAAGLSGAPSTAWAVLRGDDPLAATRAAGTMLLPVQAGRPRLVVAAVAAHLSLSFGWAGVFGASLPRNNPPARALVRGALFGLGIAAVDLGAAHVSRGRRLAGVRALPLAPQIADHVAYGAIVAAVLARPGRRRLSVPIAAPARR